MAFTTRIKFGSLTASKSDSVRRCGFDLAWDLAWSSKSRSRRDGGISVISDRSDWEGTVESVWMVEGWMECRKEWTEEQCV